MPGGGGGLGLGGGRVELLGQTVMDGVAHVNMFHLEVIDVLPKMPPLETWV